jgi:hypothetical protein
VGTQIVVIVHVFYILNGRLKSGPKKPDQDSNNQSRDNDTGDPNGLHRFAQFGVKHHQWDSERPKAENYTELVTPGQWTRAPCQRFVAKTADHRFILNLFCTIWTLFHGI